MNNTDHIQAASEAPSLRKIIKVPRGWATCTIVFPKPIDAQLTMMLSATGHCVSNASNGAENSFTIIRTTIAFKSHEKQFFMNVIETLQQDHGAEICFTFYDTDNSLSRSRGSLQTIMDSAKERMLQVISWF